MSSVDLRILNPKTLPVLNLRVFENKHSVARPQEKEVEPFSESGVTPKNSESGVIPEKVDSREAELFLEHVERKLFEIDIQYSLFTKRLNDEYLEKMGQIIELSVNGAKSIFLDIFSMIGINPSDFPPHLISLLYDKKRILLLSYLYPLEKLIKLRKLLTNNLQKQSLDREKTLKINKQLNHNINILIGKIKENIPVVFNGSTDLFLSVVYSLLSKPAGIKLLIEIIKENTHTIQIQTQLKGSFHSLNKSIFSGVESSDNEDPRYNLTEKLIDLYQLPSRPNMTESFISLNTIMRMLSKLDPLVRNQMVFQLPLNEEFMSNKTCKTIVDELVFQSLSLENEKLRILSKLSLVMHPDPISDEELNKYRKGVIPDNDFFKEKMLYYQGLYTNSLLSLIKMLRKNKTPAFLKDFFRVSHIPESRFKICFK